ncbi:ChaN family lipoprotein [Pseudoalteromonas luteoviolacea]|uniref:ChaN family lipoprotein n=1 Tax=Pseudoalteromonas luteoviolacea TaxID=43657 RepID=UPI001B360FB8|nr:ChaN family lipoprotein [Pseudoalteromonas luteoviolacea]MBQ4838614.1 ChaN family lipoprotein [Pseudoalteromonas luteoviolacea]
MIQTMHLKAALLLSTSTFLMQGCVTTNQDKTLSHSIVTLHDYTLYDANKKQQIDIKKLVSHLNNADVIFVGEYHTHSASHRLQANILPLIYRQNPNLTLSFEQFTRDKQYVLEQYIKNEIGEQTLIKQANAWDNYQSDYRPLVEFAKQYKLTTVAANTPLSVVRCVARKGPEYINTFDKQHQNWVAKDITTSSQAYQDKFIEAMSHHAPKTNKKSGPIKLSNSFYAQLARDNTMAESIYKALKSNPANQVVHFNGAFHSNYHLGTVDALKRLDPQLKVAVISPQFIDDAIDWNTGDFIYTIQALPERYVKKENLNKAIKEMMKKRKETQCEL